MIVQKLTQWLFRAKLCCFRGGGFVWSTNQCLLLLILCLLVFAGSIVKGKLFKSGDIDVVRLDMPEGGGVCCGVDTALEAEVRECVVGESKVSPMGEVASAYRRRSTAGDASSNTIESEDGSVGGGGEVWWVCWG